MNKLPVATNRQPGKVGGFRMLAFTVPANDIGKQIYELLSPHLGYRCNDSCNSGEPKQ